MLLKLFAVLYFSMLPAFLYLQFNSRKTLTDLEGVRRQPVQARGGRARLPAPAADALAFLRAMAGRLRGAAPPAVAGALDGRRHGSGHREDRSPRTSIA